LFREANEAQPFFCRVPLQSFLSTKNGLSPLKSVLFFLAVHRRVSHSPHSTTSPPPLARSVQCIHILVCVCVCVCVCVFVLRTVLFFGSGVESRAGLSLTECQPPSRLAPSSSSSSSSSSSVVPQHVRKTCLQWTPRCRWASQRCPSRRNCSPREQQSQHSCGVTRSLFFTRARASRIGYRLQIYR